MDKLINAQCNLKERITKAKINFGKQSKDRITLAYLETRLENLDSVWTSFNINHEKIVMESEGEDLEATDYYKNDLFEQVEDVYVDLKSKLKESITKLKRLVKATHESTQESSQSKPLSVQLPKISIPTFSGKYVEWTSFKDLFVSLIHNNTNLDDVQKLHYLKGHLEGEAEQLLRHIPITADNYKACWSQLEDRYNNKKYLANCILQRFMNQKNVNVESSSAIKELLDVTNECLHALENLGIDVESWDIMVIYIISQKLDCESRKLWETKNNETSGELPKLCQFKQFLENRFRALECLTPITSNRPSKNKNAMTLHVTTTNSKCIFCFENSHKLCHCKGFAKEDVDQRRKFAQTNRLCFNCLNTNHVVYACRQSTRCHLCKRKHHSLLHPKNAPTSVGEAKSSSGQSVSKDGGASESSSSSKGESTKAMSCFAKSSSQVLLATALVNVESRTGTSVCLRSLLDQGSQASFITESAVQLLALKKSPIKTFISGLGGDSQASLACRSMVSIKIQSRHDPSFVIPVKAYVMDKLTSLLPERKVVVQELPSLPSVNLADPSFDTPNKIDLLLGAQVYSQILLCGLIKGPPGSPIAQNTTLGWIFSGEVGEVRNNSNACHNVVVSMHTAYSEDTDLLKSFWELESEHYSKEKKYLTEEEQQCERIFSETTQRDEFGRYIVSLPFRTQDPQCKYGDSQQIARKRFLLLEKRLLKNPKLKQEYVGVINEYLSLGHMEVVEDQGKSDAVYLPHHAVVRNDKLTTKVRVVFDASCQGTNGVSLNQDLLVGPTLQPELRHILMRWRCFPICLVADVIKMYRQVKVAEDDVDFQRLFWRENPDDELQHLRLLRVTFGTSCAPHLAVKTLQQVAHDEGAEFPLAASRVFSDFYIDDLMTGCQSVAEGAQLYKEMNNLLGRGGFQLQKWATNSTDLLKHLQEDGAASEENLELKTDKTKILGLTWNNTSDEFEYTVQLPQLETPVTKRRVVSDIAKLFDPLGWIAPAIITAKVFIQKIWLSGIEWDQELPPTLMKNWLKFRNDLSQLTNFRIPRWIGSSADDQCVELHGFADASNVAFAAVVYARITDKNGSVHVNLITSKTKVAPIKQVSIPRLELCGATLLAKLLLEVSNVLDVPKQHLHAWTDSLVVLAWLKSHPSRWKTFIANRVAEILTVMDGNQWSHVPSKQNPADCASRGVNPSECSHIQLWQQGPAWLKHNKIKYIQEEMDTTIEEKKLKTHTVICTDVEEALFTKFSTLKRLTRVIAYCRRFLSPRSIGALTADELKLALFSCIKMCQRHWFCDEIDSFKKIDIVNKKSKLTSLNPFLDADEILRVGGRLQKADLVDSTKHPILIPQGSTLAKLIIADAHQRTLHGGPQIMLNYLRTNFWILNAKSLVRQCVRKCVVCVRHSAKTKQQMMGQLPEVRVNACRPFLRSGVDYAGPISIRPTKGRGYHSTKGYICLFVCMATKAIHLEVVSDMTAQTFIAAFKRFVARRGHVADVWSDNGTTFVGGAKELKALFDAEKSSVALEIADWLAGNGTNWHFIPPHAPNFGGLWEAGVRSTKHHLKRVVGNSTLTFEEMTTLLSQIEACLNSRPISQLPTYPDDPYPLTPGHFLVGEPLVVVPDRNYENSGLSTLSRWHLTQRMLQDFWRKWSTDYLTQLYHRYKWTNQVSEPNIGDVVLVKEDELPPAKWLFGVITEKHTGSDKLTRVVSVKCKNSIFKRALSKLIILPVAKE